MNQTGSDASESFFMSRTRGKVPLWLTVCESRDVMFVMFVVRFVGRTKLMDPVRGPCT